MDKPAKSWLRQFWHYQCSSCLRITIRLRPELEDYGWLKCPACGFVREYWLTRGRWR